MNTRDLNLSIPTTLLFSLETRAANLGVSIESLCLSLLSEEEREKSLIEPDFYSTLNHSSLRDEIRVVITSALPMQDIKRRVNQLQTLITKRYILR